jgi:hypothetical protein
MLFFERMRQVEYHGKYEQERFGETFFNPCRQTTVIFLIVTIHGLRLSQSFRSFLLFPYESHVSVPPYPAIYG